MSNKEVIVTPTKTKNTQDYSLIAPNNQTYFAPKATEENPSQYGVINYEDLSRYSSEILKQHNDSPDSHEVIRNDIYNRISAVNDRIDEIDTESADQQNQINNLKNEVAINRADILSNTKDIENNTKTIAEIKEQMITGIDRIGTYPTQDTFPTESDLNLFVRNNTTPSRDPKNGDYVDFVLSTNNNHYKIYFTNGWQEPDLQAPIEKSKNDTYGVIKGTGLDSTKDTQINIIEGIISNIYTKNLEGVPTDIKSRLNIIDSTQQDILKGVKKVGLADKSLKDSEGNQINTTYARASDVYTKAESDSKYLDKSYTEPNYYTAAGIVEDLPTTPSDEVQFDINISSVGLSEIFNLNKIIKAPFTFSKSTTDNSNIWIKTDRDCSLDFVMTTKGVKDGVEKLLNVERTGELTFIANTPKAITINSIYNGLLNEKYELVKNDKINKVLDVEIFEATPTNIKVLCGSTYASVFKFNAVPVDLNYNIIDGKKKVEMLASDWVDNGNGTYTLTVPQTRHELAPSTEYTVEMQYRDSANSYQSIKVAPKIKENGDIILIGYEPFDCRILIYFNAQLEEKGVLFKTNGTVKFNQNGTNPIQTITNITSGELIPLNVSNSVIDVSEAPLKSDGSIQKSWYEDYNTGSTPNNLVFYNSNMPVKPNSSGSVLLINPIIGQNTKVSVVLSYNKESNTDLTIGIVVLNTNTNEVIRYSPLSINMSETTGSAEYSLINLAYKTNDKYVIFLEPIYGGGNLTNITLNEVKLVSDFYPLNKEE